MTNEFESKEIIESAKAVQETAKATNNAIDLARDTGGFFNRVFGDLVEDGVGIIADKVKYYRKARAIELADKVENILISRKSNKNTKAVPPKVAVPLIENATLEEDDELHNLWAALLANAMDPNFSDDINNVHVAILKEIQQLDARILMSHYKAFINDSEFTNPSEVVYAKKGMEITFNCTVNDVEQSILNLMRLGCLRPGILTGSGIVHTTKKGEKFPSPIYRGTDQFHLSVLGISLMKAVL